MQVGEDIPRFTSLRFEGFVSSSSNLSVSVPRKTSMGKGFYVHEAWFIAAASLHGAPVACQHVVPSAGETLVALMGRFRSSYFHKARV